MCVQDSPGYEKTQFLSCGIYIQVERLLGGRLPVLGIDLQVGFSLQMVKERGQPERLRDILGQVPQKQTQC